MFHVQHVLERVIAKDTELDVQQYPTLDRVPKTEQNPKIARLKTKTRLIWTECLHSDSARIGPILKTGERLVI